MSAVRNPDVEVEAVLASKTWSLKHAELETSRGKLCCLPYTWGWKPYRSCLHRDAGMILQFKWDFQAVIYSTPCKGCILSDWVWTHHPSQGEVWVSQMCQAWRRREFLWKHPKSGKGREGYLVPEHRLLRFVPRPAKDGVRQELTPSMARKTVMPVCCLKS